MENKALAIVEGNKQLAAFKKQMREAIANYMRSEGCGCCRNEPAHKEHTEALAKLLNVKKYEDKSGYNFNKYKSK